MDPTVPVVPDRPPTSRLGSRSRRRVGAVVRPRPARRRRAVADRRRTRCVLARAGTRSTGRGRVADGVHHHVGRAADDVHRGDDRHRARPPAEIVVHVAGAVVSPGVRRLAAGARVVDAIDAAGGLAPDAAADNVNLAAPLHDGDRVYVPRARRVRRRPRGRDPGTGAPERQLGCRTAAAQLRDDWRSSRRFRASGRRWRPRSSPTATSTARSSLSSSWPTCPGSGRRSWPRCASLVTV